MCFFRTSSINRVVIMATIVAGLLGGCVTRSADDLADREWVELKSDHFIVYSEVGEFWSRRMLQRLEIFRSFVISHLDLAGADNPLPFRIVLLRNASSLQAIVPRSDIFGMYQTTYQGGMALVDMSARAQDGTSSLEIIYTPSGPIYRTRTGTRPISMEGVLHEYVHHLLANDTSRRYPLWFNEGYAEYLSTFDIAANGQAIVGQAPMHRVEALQKARWIPLDRLFQVKGYEEGHGYGDFYAQAWAVVHYMLADTERAEQTDRFLDQLNEGEDLIVAFEASFDMPLQQMSAGARSRAKSRRTSSRRLSFETEIASDAVPRLLSLDERSVLLAEMILTFSPDRRVALPHLQQALQYNVANIRARALLAGLHMYYGEDQLALDTLNGASDDAMDADIQCQFGHFYADKAIVAVQERDPKFVGWIDEARRHYEAAISIDENHVEAYVGLGRTYILTDAKDAQRGFDALNAAFELLPTNMETQLLLGHMLFASGQYEAAENAYQEVIAWSRDAQTINSAQDMVGMIEENRLQYGKALEN